MTEWRETTLGDICRAIVDCEHKTAPPGDGYAFSVGTRAMKSGRLVVEACKPVSEPTFASWTRRMRPEPGDLILAREAPVGQVVLVPHGRRLCLGQRTVLIRADAARVHPRFLHYWLLGPDAQGTMAAQAAGATVPHLNVENIRNLDASRLPTDPWLQTFTAETLGAIDDLIENNRRRIEVLEQMAQAIYREWFVRFRYPGHEDVVLVDSPLGPIPQGWSIRPLSDVADARRGLSWGRASETEDSTGTQVATIPNIGHRLHFRGCTRLADVSERDLDRFSLRTGDILLIGSNGNPDRVGQAVRVAADADVLFASFLMRVRPDPTKASSILLFFQLTDPTGIVASMRASAVGSTGLRNVRISTLRASQVVVPDHATLHQFDTTVRPLQETSHRLDEQIGQLEAMRDLLLPRLVSGQINVGHLDLDAAVESLG